MNLIECSTIGGVTSAYWFDVDELTGPRNLLRAYKADGSRRKWRAYGDFEWSPMLVHRTNIIERGTPRLAPGWKARADVAMWRGLQSSGT